MVGAVLKAGIGMTRHDLSGDEAVNTDVQGRGQGGDVTNVGVENAALKYGVEGRVWNICLDTEGLNVAVTREDQVLQPGLYRSILHTFTAH